MTDQSTECCSRKQGWNKRSVIEGNQKTPTTNKKKGRKKGRKEIDISHYMRYAPYHLYMLHVSIHLTQTSSHECDEYVFMIQRDYYY